MDEKEQQKADEQFTAVAMRVMADQISQTLKPFDMGFALVIFPKDSNGAIGNYISDCTRETMINALRQTADRLEEKKDKPSDGR